MEPQNLGKELLEKLSDTRSEKGKIDPEDLNEILNYCLNMMKSHITNTREISLYNEIKELSEELNKAKKEFDEINGDKSLGEYHILDATLELLEVTKETENATNTILDRAEEILQISSSITDPVIAEKLSTNAAVIMEACNFQDLTGQRINKVIKKLDDLDEKVSLLLKAIGQDSEKKLTREEFKNKSANEAAKAVKEENSLLNGPQLKKSAPTQSDIDDLFNNI